MHINMKQVVIVVSLLFATFTYCQKNIKSDEALACDPICSCCLDTVVCDLGYGGCNGECKDGYFGGKCLNRCPKNCVRCKDPYNPNGMRSLWGVANCTDCSDGHYSTDEYFQCQFSCSEGCLRCNSATDCTECLDGFFMDDKPCRRCSPGCVGGQCERYNGTCSCVEGFTGDRCETCVTGRHGTNCSEDCPATCQNTGCYRDSGLCLTCPLHFAGGLCEECIFGYYGFSLNCSKECSTGCTGGQCEQANGTCSCIEGFTGERCEVCAMGRYGNNCSRECSTGCTDEQCEQINGTCRCIEGFTGDRCEDCVAGRYGNNCSEKCPATCNSTECYRDSGHCLTCPTFFAGALCEECIVGYFDMSLNCSNECSSGCINGQCEQTNGTCTCIEGFTGERCETCITGKHGTNCSEDCPATCRNTECYKESGLCLACPTFFTGIVCDECVTGYHGLSCERYCPQNCRNNECTRDTGRCVNGCLDNYHGDTCVDCREGKYGQDCVNDCPVNCADGVCDVSGKCLSCSVRFSGETCTDCTQGFYGSNCSMNCLDGCKDRICDQATGFCHNCENAKYGHLCDLQCSAYCVFGSCEQLSGDCIGGCKPGYSGDKCCMPGERCRECHSPSDCMVCVGGKYGDDCGIDCPYDCMDQVCFKTNGTCITMTNSVATTVMSGISPGTFAGSFVGMMLGMATIVLAVILLRRRQCLHHFRKINKDTNTPDTTSAANLEMDDFSMREEDDVMAMEHYETVLDRCAVSHGDEPDELQYERLKVGELYENA